MVDHTFTLEADPAVVDQVDLHIPGLPMAMRPMEQVGPRLDQIMKSCSSNLAPWVGRPSSRHFSMPPARL